MRPAIREALVCQLAPRLLSWFGREQRDLPWRRTRDPYRVWVSEVMLQQTQVGTVIPYYRRFLRAFPTARALAAAPLDEVLRLWAGLGYYSRARNLHRAAQVIVAEHGGRFPRALEAIRALPGVGEYTAGAIASIAFGERVPCVDGNVLRVLARVHCVTGDVRTGRTRRRLEALAWEAVPAERPGDYNQALMELGSLVCRPTDPACGECCLSDLCEARRRGRQRGVRTPRKREGTRRVRAVAGIAWRRGCVLIARRPLEGVWGGLWEFPNCRPVEGETDFETLTRLFAEGFGLIVEVGERLVSLTHGIMHERIELAAYGCKVVDGRTKASAHVAVKWVRPEELAEYALPAPHRKLVLQQLTPSARTPARR
ncbi:MAG: A/G-specific adenine glycosylase [Armatimonadetes bacterium]|nr:A/G-specific adenine glycosylase [Armatimonadota bacterium]